MRRADMPRLDTVRPRAQIAGPHRGIKTSDTLSIGEDSMGTSRHRRGATRRPSAELVAGNGLLDRRALLGGGVALAGAMATGAAGTVGAAADPLADAPWTLEPGGTIRTYEVPSRFEKNVVRTLSNPNGEPRNSHGRTPHHLLNGTITPNGLHFV